MRLLRTLRCPGRNGRLSAVCDIAIAIGICAIQVDSTWSDDRLVVAEVVAPTFTQSINLSLESLDQLVQRSLALPVPATAITPAVAPEANTVNPQPDNTTDAGLESPSISHQVGLPAGPAEATAPLLPSSDTLTQPMHAPVPSESRVDLPPTQLTPERGHSEPSNTHTASVPSDAAPDDVSDRSLVIGTSEEPLQSVGIVAPPANANAGVDATGRATPPSPDARPPAAPENSDTEGRRESSQDWPRIDVAQSEADAPTRDRVEPDQQAVNASPGDTAEVDVASPETPPQSAPDIRLFAPGTNIVPLDSLPPIARSSGRSRPRSVLAMRRSLDRCLSQHESQRLNTEDDSCWSVMHHFLGWGSRTQIEIGSGRRAKLTNAIQWVSRNQPCGGRRLMFVREGRLSVRQGPGYQGHPGQFLAMLGQTRIDSAQRLYVGRAAFTVADLIAEEQKTCSAKVELTFKLLGLIHYLPTDTAWRTDQGETWSMERLLLSEVTEPINGVACGGTHRLMAISVAVERRQREQKPMTGVWQQAQSYVRQYHRYTASLQNSDGSFSSDWFKRRSDWGDRDRRLQTTGHIGEWLVRTVPTEELYVAPTVTAVNFLTHHLSRHRFHEWEVGPKGHAIRALRLYRQRVFEAQGASMARRRQSGG